MTTLIASEVTGVSWDSHHQRWKVQIYLNGKNTYVGVSKDEQTAIKMRLDAEQKHGWMPPVNQTKSFKYMLHCTRCDEYRGVSKSHYYLYDHIEHKNYRVGRCRACQSKDRKDATVEKYKDKPRQTKYILKCPYCLEDRSVTANAFNVAKKVEGETYRQAIHMKCLKPYNDTIGLKHKRRPKEQVRKKASTIKAKRQSRKAFRDEPQAPQPKTDTEIYSQSMYSIQDAMLRKAYHPNLIRY